MKDVLYIPVKLKKVKEEVLLTHKRSGFFNDNNLEEEQFKKFIKILVKTKKAKVVDIAKTYDHELITKLSFYIHTNSYNVNCENLFEVLFNLANDSDWENIFSEWQNHYKNNDIRILLVNACSKVQEFKNFKDNIIPKANLNWLNEKNAVDYLCEQFGDSDSEKIFGNILNKLGVLYGKQLYTDCLKHFLLYCSRIAYLNIDTNMILTSYYGYIENEKILFIHNFVSKLTIEDLDNQEKVYEAIKRSISIKERLEEYLRKMGSYYKFSQWMERMKLMLAFEGDRDRFDFWIKYQKGNKIVDTNIDTLYIDFGNYVITEFKGRAAGPSYLFEKKYFDNTIYSKMRYMSKNDFQRDLYALYNQNKILERLEHKPSNRGWWIYFSNALSRYGIYQS